MPLFKVINLGQFLFVFSAVSIYMEYASCLSIRKSALHRKARSYGPPVRHFGPPIFCLLFDFDADQYRVQMMNQTLVECKSDHSYDPLDK